MKKTICSVVAAAGLIGCQSPGTPTATTTQPSLGQQLAQAQASARAQAQKGSSSGVMQASATVPATNTSGKVITDPNVVKASGTHSGYNHGWGASQNNMFRQRVAGAVPSTGGMVPGGGAPNYVAPGMGHPMGGPGMGGPGMPPGMGGPGMPGMGGQVPLGPRFTTTRSQIRFVKPTGMKVAWQTGAPDGSFTPPQLEAPARYNFVQARIYRLKLTEIERRPGLELYPTLEVYPGNSKVDAFLAHNPIPVELTDEDLDQVQAGNFVTKVIYLPDAKYQELAIGVDTIVSTRLDPGVDPVKEANRRGAILAVLRLGSVDLEMTHSPDIFGMPGMGGMPMGPMMGPPMGGVPVQGMPLAPSADGGVMPVAPVEGAPMGSPMPTPGAVSAAPATGNPMPVSPMPVPSVAPGGSPMPTPPAVAPAPNPTAPVPGSPGKPAVGGLRIAPAR